MALKIYLKNFKATIMNIEVDYNPTPSKVFFISVSVNDKEAISFDYTTKAHRIIKQILVDKKPFPANQSISSEWDALVMQDKKLVKKYHVKWVDLGKKDWCNDEIWETVEEKPISKELTYELLEYSRLISDNYKNLSKFTDKLENFENLLSKEMANF